MPTLVAAPNGCNHSGSDGPNRPTDLALPVTDTGTWPDDHPITCPPGESLMAVYAANRDRLGPERLAHLERHEADMEASDRRQLDNPKSDAATLEALLRRMGIRVCYDVRSTRVWWDHGNGWEPATDRHDAALQEQIAAVVRYSRDTWPRSLNALLHDNETDLFADWLDRLSPWDGHPRLEGWIDTCFELAHRDDPLAVWAGRYLCLGPVLRCRDPGAKLDETPVFVGPQGCGKSTALRMLLPAGPWGDLWFSDSLDLSADNKGRAEATLGRVIVEAAEMTGSTRAEVERLKAYLSRGDDGATRLAYRRNPEPMPRRFVIAGTTNSTESLPNDPTGLRRFVPIEITSGNPDFVRFWIDQHRDQLWAEALAMHDHGIHPRLPDGLQRVQADRAEQHRRGDPIIEDAIDSFLALKGTSTFSLHAAAVAVGLIKPDDGAGSLTKRDQNRLTAALRSKRCTNIRITENNQKIRVWQHNPDRLDHHGPPLPPGIPQGQELPF